MVGQLSTHESKLKDHLPGQPGAHVVGQIRRIVVGARSRCYTTISLSFPEAAINVHIPVLQLGHGGLWVAQRETERGSGYKTYSPAVNRSWGSGSRNSHRHGSLAGQSRSIVLAAASRLGDGA